MTTAWLALLVLGMVLNFESMIALVGSFSILAGIIFIVVVLVIGYLLGGSDNGVKTIMGLGTAQRNISAALVVAGQNFSADVIPYVMVIALIALVVLMPTAAILGKRTRAAEEVAAAL